MLLRLHSRFNIKVRKVKIEFLVFVRWQKTDEKDGASRTGDKL